MIYYVNTQPHHIIYVLYTLKKCCLIDGHSILFFLVEINKVNVVPPTKKQFKNSTIVLKRCILF